LSSQAYRHVVRLLGFDLPGDVRAPYALSRIRGLSINTATVLCRQMGIDVNKRLGEVEEDKLEAIEKLLRDKRHQAFPSWFRNRKDDPLEPDSVHLAGSELLAGVREDVELLKRIRCWRGVRHSLGLKVRGQRSRVTGRFGRSVGVSKGRAAAAQAAAKPAEGASEEAKRRWEISGVLGRSGEVLRILGSVPHWVTR